MAYFGSFRLLVQPKRKLLLFLSFEQLCEKKEADITGI